MDQPTPHACDLVSALRAGLPPDTILRMGRAFQDQGSWSVLDPVDESGLPLVGVWLRHMAHDPDKAVELPPEHLEFLSGGTTLADILKMKASPGSMELGQDILTQISEGPRRRSVMLWSRRFFDALSDAHLDGARLTRYGSPATGRNGIFRVAVAHARLDVALALLERGCSWAPPGQPPVAKSIATEQAWEFFLETGGDPRMMVSNPSRDGGSMALWEYLIAHAVSPGHTDSEALSGLRRAISKWADRAAPDRVEKRELEAYWSRLGRYGTLQELSSAVRARKDWPTLRNEKGQNPLMVAMGQHRGVIDSVAKVGKGLPLFSHVDNRGWSFWHYLLSHTKGVSRGQWSLAIEHAPPRPTPSRGLMVALLMGGGLEQGALPKADDLPHIMAGPKKKGLVVEDWWAGTQDELVALGHYLAGEPGPHDKTFYAGSKSNTGGWQPAQACLNLASLVRAAPPPSSAPAGLLGALAFNELITSSYRAGPARFDVCDALIAQGAALEMTPAIAKRAGEILPHLSPDAQARMTGLEMAGSLPQAPGAARPRM